MITGIAVGGFGAGALEATRLWAEHPINGLPRVAIVQLTGRLEAVNKPLTGRRFGFYPSLFSCGKAEMRNFAAALGNKGDVLFRLHTRNRTLRNRIRNTVFGSP